MRAMIIAATLACIGLAGCDNSANAPAPTVQAVAPPCNCEAASPKLTRLTPPHVSHRHARTASYRDYEESYSYQSQSRSYDQNESEDRNPDRDASNGNNVWVDGYGRSHYAMTASAAPDDRARLAPWHGYDQDCDDEK